jgi:hypothetical protein
MMSRANLSIADCSRAEYGESAVCSNCSPTCDGSADSESVFEIGRASKWRGTTAMAPAVIPLENSCRREIVISDCSPDWTACRRRARDDAHRQLSGFPQYMCSTLSSALGDHHRDTSLRIMLSVTYTCSIRMECNIRFALGSNTTKKLSTANAIDTRRHK